jgi:hypothetical protein
MNPGTGRDPLPPAKIKKFLAAEYGMPAGPSINLHAEASSHADASHDAVVETSTTMGVGGRIRTSASEYDDGNLIVGGGQPAASTPFERRPEATEASPAIANTANPKLDDIITATIASTDQDHAAHKKLQEHAANEFLAQIDRDMSQQQRIDGSGVNPSCKPPVTAPPSPVPSHATPHTVASEAVGASSSLPSQVKGSEAFIITASGSANGTSAEPEFDGSYIV